MMNVKNTNSDDEVDDNNNKDNVDNKNNYYFVIIMLDRIFRRGNAWNTHQRTQQRLTKN